jgi:hypothetical protein
MSINTLDVTGNTTIDGNLNVGFNLTCGDITATAIYGTAATQIQSNINTAISNYNPFWVPGKVDPNANVLVSKGKVGFTVTRTATGNYRVDFATAHPNGTNYVINIASDAANYWLDVSSTTSSSFLVALRASNFAAQNSTLHFTVLA